MSRRIGEASCPQITPILTRIAEIVDAWELQIRDQMLAEVLVLARSIAEMRDLRDWDTLPGEEHQRYIQEARATIEQRDPDAEARYVESVRDDG